MNERKNVGMTGKETAMGNEKHGGHIHRKGSLGYMLSERSTQETPSTLVEFLSRSWSASSMQAFRKISNSLDDGLQLSLIDEDEDDSNRTWVDFRKISQLMKRVRERLFPNAKRKEELKLKAAMSVAGVAAAVAALIKSTNDSCDGEDKEKLAVAAAATLVAVQCAEAAERMGARHASMASFIRSTVGAVGPSDIVALTAAAATNSYLCAALKGTVRKGKLGGRKVPTFRCPSREFGFVHNKEILSRGTELPTCINNGKTHLKILHVYPKDKQVFLKVRTKHLGGTFTTFRNYIIKEVKGGTSECVVGTCVTNEVNGYCSICIRTQEGADVHISFKHYEKWRLWSSTISRLLLLAK